MIDIYNDLIEYGLDVTVYDPWVDKDEVKREFGIKVLNEQSEISPNNSALILAVSHKQFREMDISTLLVENSFVYDIKGVLNKELTDARL